MARTRVLVLAALLVILSILSPRLAAAGPNAQSGGQVFYRWLLTFDFTTSDDGLLTTTVRHLYPNGTYQDFVRNTPVLCDAQGTVTIAGGAALFVNNSYLECELPSIRDEIQILYPPAAPDDYQDPFWVRTITSINPGISTGNAGNPTLIHPDIQVYLPYNHKTAQGKARLVTQNQDSTSTPFTLSATATVLINQRNFFAESGSINCSTAFRYQGNPLSTSAYTCPQYDEAMNFSLEAETITIGYSAADSTYFNGSIHHIEVDPVEWGDLD